ncbi:MAG: MFS transporter [Candidatus Eremiobacteraeota bacterium]|nr:MFS transporter [Candidatus Eremiobacteraeota bacterium]
MLDALRRRNFGFLLGGQFVSDFGGQLTAFALPTIAIMVLHATSFQVASLQAAQLAVIPLLALLAGAVVDRVRRKPLMIVANVVRLFAIAALPAFALAGKLSLSALFVSAIVVSIASLIFDAAYQPFLRTLLGAAHYTHGNAKMTTSASLAQAGGNAVSGPMVQIAGAAFVLAANVLTYVVGTIALFFIRIEERPQCDDRDGSLLSALGWIFGDRVLRNIALSTTLLYFGCAIVNAVLALYVYRVLHVSAATYGILLGIANAGVVGGLFAQRAAEKLGPRVTLACAAASIVIGQALCLSAAVPLAGIALGRIAISFASPLYDVVQQTLVTFRVPEERFGRTCAALRTITWTAFPLGAVAGGALVDRIGFHTTIALGATVCAFSVIALFARTRAGRTWSACWPSPMMNLPEPSNA